MHYLISRKGNNGLMSCLLCTLDFPILKIGKRPLELFGVGLVVGRVLAGAREGEVGRGGVLLFVTVDCPPGMGIESERGRGRQRQRPSQQYIQFVVHAS